MFRHNGADGLSILCRSPEAIEHLTKPEDVDMAMVNFAASVIEMKLNEFALTEQRKWQDGIFVNLSNKKPSFDMTEQLIDVKLVFGGAVSVLRTTHCYECCKVFGIPLFVDGSVVKGIHNQRFVLAWNVPEITNAQKATSRLLILLLLSLTFVISSDTIYQVLVRHFVVLIDYLC